MPPRKRTDTSKSMPSTSPTASTTNPPTDHDHHLRHTGPSIGRAGVAAPSKPPPAPTSETPPVQKGPREKKQPLAEVSPPGAQTSFSKFMYVLLVVALLLLGWYVYGMMTLLERLKDEVGWWSVVEGDSGGRMRWEGWKFGSDRSAGANLEGSLNALADALGISPVQIASAVKPVVPQASLASLASKSRETGGSEALGILFVDTNRNDRDEGIVEESEKGATEEDRVD